MSEGRAAATQENGRAKADWQEEKAFGFWIYLMSDAVLFALLFATYIVLSNNTAGGPSGGELFNLKRTFAETVVLLASSATFGLAAVAMSAQDARGALRWLGATFLLGVVFVALEIGEFRGLIEMGAGPERSGFLSAFFTLTGTHGLHVSMGLIGILVLSGQLITKGLTAPVASRLFRLGLFWHFLDIVWIAIFSVVYLPGVLDG